MLRGPSRLLLPLLLTLAACVPADTKVVLDQSHSNRHGVGPGEDYEAFRRLLEEAGYPLEVWAPEQTSLLTWAGLLGCPTCNPPIPRNDVDILIEAMPQQYVADWFLVRWVEQWVREGGVLLLIGDHKDYPLYLNVLAARFGLEFANVAAIYGDGFSHCPPGVRSCPKSSISYPPEASELPILFGGGTHVTTYGGSYVRILDPQLETVSLLRLWKRGFHPQYAPLEDLEGEHTLLLAYYGAGAVVAAAEAAMWSCGRGPGMVVGWCADSLLGDAEFNDDFILNLFRWLSLFRRGAPRPLIGDPDALPPRAAAARQPAGRRSPHR